MVPALLLTIWASIRVNGQFSRYSKVASKKGYTGYQAAREILDKSGLSHVKIQEVRGRLSDHYDPSNNVLRLSMDVSRVPSIASIGVAAHEAGHAIQQAKNYSLLGLRQALVPVTQFSAWVFNILVIAGIVVGFTFHSMGLFKVALIFLAVTVFFSIITLPVELNASSRARKLLLQYGIVTKGEDVHVGRVLNSAAMTYIAAAASSVITLVYYLIGFGSSRD